VINRLFLITAICICCICIAGSADAQAPTTTPTPQPLVTYFPTEYHQMFTPYPWAPLTPMPALSLTPRPWATPTRPTFGQPFAAPPLPDLSQPDLNQAYGFDAIGDENTGRLLIYFAEVLIGFYLWLTVNAGEIVRGMRILLIVLFIAYGIYSVWTGSKYNPPSLEDDQRPRFVDIFRTQRTARRRR
jgi:hypothetical protein